MRIAISTENGQVGQHFGRCAQYTIVDIENKKMIDKKVISNPGHAPGAIPKFLNEKGCDIIVTGGMGKKAQDFFIQFGLDYIIGVQGKIEDVIRDYLNDTLEIGESSCDHGEGKGDGQGHRW
ncbi:MAG: NifB/NifX family molybdenum-iron cluster-binding protein [Candidatus Cloacimonadota bacterium]|nr:NifB/NifX family molybdenum-iron cluster-binding protein [Candidatus Cloacimonadota bacterium]